jgi:hypothetical protein
MAQQPPGPPNYPPPPPDAPPAQATAGQPQAPAYPPPPPGGAYPAPPPAGAAPVAAGAYGADPYAAQRAIEAWATSHGYTLGLTPDPAWYQAWSPFVYLFRMARVGRELRAEFQGTSVFLVEAFDPDPLKQASGDACALCGFVTSPKLACRVAIRSKLGGGVMNELKSGFGALFSQSAPGGVLGDPTFEAHFDVSSPSRDEGNRALPLPLRQHLLQSGWRGILETRPGGLVCATFGQRGFDPPTLDAAHLTLGQLYTLASS